MKLDIFKVTAAVLLSAGIATAAPQDTINEIVKGLAGEGFTRVEIKNRLNGVKIEAHGPNGSVERIYDGNGVLVKEETHSRQGTFGFGDRDRDRDRDRSGQRSATNGFAHDDDGPDHDRDDDHGGRDRDRDRDRDDHGGHDSDDDHGGRDRDREDRDHGGRDREDRDDD